MPSRLLAVLATAVLALAGCGDDAPPEPGPRTPDVVTIVQDDADFRHRPAAQLERTLDELVAGGTDWVRVTAGWSVIAPDRAPADPADPASYPRGAWAALDRLFALAEERGLGVNVDIAFWAPRWAVARPSPDPERQRDGISAAAYADFAEAVARRYPQAAAFTVWNEPNLALFWLPQWERAGGAWRAASPHAYRDLVQAAMPRIEAAAPDALTLIGATSSLGSDVGVSRDDRVSPLHFLRQMACLDPDPRCEGAEPLPGDGWSHHPYSGGLAPYVSDALPLTARMADLDRLTTLLREVHAAGRSVHPLPLYITEYGYQTNPPDPTWDTTPDQQARWMSEAERIARANPDVRSVSQFLVRDTPENPGGTLAERWSNFQTGYRFVDGRPKPLAAAFPRPLVALARPGGEVLFWGLVRGAGPALPVRVERLVDGRWETLATATTDTDGSFEVTARTPANGVWRLAAAGRDGAPLLGAR